MGLLKAADTFFALRFLRLLTTPWEKTGAFKNGIIDKSGQVIKKPETSEEKSVYNIFHRLVFNIKRLLNRIPFGKTTLASYAVGLWLIKEHTGMSEKLMGELLQEAFDYNPLDDTSLTESFYPAQIESGEYMLDENVFFINGNMVNLNNSLDLTINENTICPVGSIFNIPIYKTLDKQTRQYILITNKNLIKK